MGLFKILQNLVAICYSVDEKCLTQAINLRAHPQSFRLTAMTNNVKNNVVVIVFLKFNSDRQKIENAFFNF